MPELSLSLDLHLHHRVIGVLDALQRLLDAREQVDDLLFAEQDLTVRGREMREVGLSRGGRGSPGVGIYGFDDNSPVRGG